MIKLFNSNRIYLLIYTIYYIYILNYISILSLTYSNIDEHCTQIDHRIQYNCHYIKASLTFEGMARRSPLGRVNSLLSSRTEFRFSTHSGSTSPSNIIQCFLLISPRTLSMILGEESGSEFKV